MGLFDLLGEIIVAPIRITKTVAVATVKTTLNAMTGDMDGVVGAADQAAEEVEETLQDVVNAADK